MHLDAQDYLRVGWGIQQAPILKCLPTLLSGQVQPFKQAVTVGKTGQLFAAATFRHDLRGVFTPPSTAHIHS